MADDDKPKYGGPDAPPLIPPAPTGDESTPAEGTPPEGTGAPMPAFFLSWPVLQLSAERPLPGPLYLCLRHKLVRWRDRADSLDGEQYNKLVFNRVKYVFIDEADKPAFESWSSANVSEDASTVLGAENPEAKPIVEATHEQRRAMMDIFESPKDDKAVKAAIDTSKKVVTEFLKKPFAVNNIQAIQKYAKGALDHSVNVSVLSVFLGLRMGYSHQIILENLALGGLFHDVGKVLVEKKGDALMSDEDPAMQQHPKLGKEMLEKSKEKISNEVKMIVAQHHELLDGTGFPAKLKGLAVYDLARLVAISNTYDNLVSKSKLATLKERATEALDQLEKNYEGKLDPKKLEKAVKILRYSIL